MFKLLQTSVDKAITELESRVSHAGQQYKVTRSVGGAPVVLNVKGPGDVFFTADLVPAFEMPMHELKICCRELYDRVQEMFRERHVDFVKEFLMVALKDADKDSFEINFHRSEKELLSRTGGCVKKVIMLIKYLRDMKGGTTLKLWSHLLKVNGIIEIDFTWKLFKTSVMNTMLREQVEFWNNKNLTKCFVTSMQNLMIGLQKELIYDTFFPDVRIFYVIINIHVNIYSTTCLIDLIVRLRRSVVSGYQD